MSKIKQQEVNYQISKIKNQNQNQKMLTILSEPQFYQKCWHFDQKCWQYQISNIKYQSYVIKDMLSKISNICYQTVLKAYIIQQNARMFDNQS